MPAAPITPPPGMCAARAKVVAFERGAEICPLRRGTQEEDLVQQQFAVEDVAARDARDGFDILRRDDLHADDAFADVRRVSLDGRDDRFAEFVSLRVIPAALEIVRRVLHEARHHVLSRRRHVRVDHGREDHVEIRALRDLPILGVVVGALDVINARADGHRAAMQDRILSLAFEWQCREVGQLAQGDVDLARRAARAEVLDRGDKFIGEMFRLDELQEGALRVGGGHHNFGIEFVAVFEGDTHRASVFDLDLLHACVDSDLHPKRFRRVQDGAADSAGAVLGKTPGAERAVDFAHVVMEQHIRRPWRARTEERADDPAGGFGAFQRVGLEPLFKQIRGGLRGEFGDGVQLFFRKTRRVLTNFEQAQSDHEGIGMKGQGG